MAGESLVVARDDRRSAEWVRTVAARGLVPLAAPSARRAMWLIHERRVAVAIIDWSRTDEDLPELLAELWRDQPAAVNIVRTDLAESTVAAVRSAHPGALIDGPASTSAALGTWINRLLGHRVGDLSLNNGAVIHVPTGAMKSHRLFVQLLLAHPRPVVVGRVGGEAQELSRIRTWLCEHRSVVAIECQRGTGLHRLVVTEPAEAA